MFKGEFLLFFIKLFRLNNFNDFSVYIKLIIFIFNVNSIFIRFMGNMENLSKQKTAYEILRSDWSSDVCSSDLEHLERLTEYANLFGKN